MPFNNLKYFFFVFRDIQDIQDIQDPYNDL